MFMNSQRTRVKPQVPEKHQTSKLRYGMWGQGQVTWSPSQAQNEPIPSGEAGAPDYRETTLGPQNYSKDPQIQLSHLKPSPAVTGTRESFLRGNLPSMDSFPFSKPKWLARDLPRKYERSKQAEKENLCWNLDKGHSFSQRNSPDHPQADICWEQMRSPGSPESHHSPTSLKAKHNSTEQLF